ncbi:hypothetical protein [Streptosporangium sp. KLBMP 9127]|nr:hypothetical protein [Streptosporangium sp. KLBMP 9127]
MNPRSIFERLVSLAGQHPWTAPRPGDGVSAGLLAALARGDDLPPPFQVMHFVAIPPLLNYGERGFEVDQTNRSVVVDEQIVVKWLTPPAASPHPAPELLGHLTRVGFTATAPPYAALTMRAPDGGELLLALVTGYLPGARDGWTWCVDDAAGGRTAFAAPLGGLAADLHLALATPSPATAGTRPAADGPAWLRRAEDALAEALDLTDGTDGDWLAARARTLRDGLAGLAAERATPLIRIHGDLHVGQILRWRDGYAVIDFDGNPTVAEATPYQPAARDLAQLATSLEHAGQVAIRRLDADPSAVARWTRRARAELLDAYRARLAEHGRAELLDESLLGPFEIEQECRELIYAARHLPRWRYAPMGVLRTRYPGQETS